MMIERNHNKTRIEKLILISLLVIIFSITFIKEKKSEEKYGRCCII